VGQTGTFIREVGGGAIWFGVNELVAKHFMQRRAQSSGRSLAEFSKKDLSPIELATAGGAAGAIFNLAIFPADSVKSMMQTEEELRPRAANAIGKSAPRRTFLQTGVAMWKAQGFKGLYAGCGVTVARAIPSSAMIFLIYDTLSQKFG
jgi:ornithine carrier protein